MDTEKLKLIKSLFPDYYINIIEKQKQKEYLKEWKKKNPHKKYKGGGGAGSSAMPPVFCPVCDKNITYRNYKGHLLRSRHQKKLALNNN